MPRTLAEIELRSEEVQEVLDAPPSWLIRWGLTVILLLIVLLLLIANVVKYPDVISGELMLTTENPPIKIVANSSGKLNQIFKAEGEIVRTNDVLAEVENPITSQGAEYIKALVERVEIFLDRPDIAIDFPDSDYVFGSVQAEYNELKKQCLNYHQWVTDIYQQEEVRNLKQKIEQYNQLVAITEKQSQISLREMANAEEKYKADQMLYKEGVLAKLQFYQEESAYHQRQQEIENLKKTTTQNRITLIDLQKQLLDIQHAKEEQERKFREGIMLNLHAIRNQMNDWQKSYLVTAPLSGKLSYLAPLNDKQFVQAGAFIFAIVPDDESYLGIINIPSQGVGKIKTGQEVRIKFNNYPYQEYGQVYGTIKNISLLANEDTYRAEVELPKGLTTSYNKLLDYSPEMMGSAEIITEDLSMMERTFYSIRSIFDQ
jgi:multidrug efflux pump subunit AcrA (membrane-fusion protein)